MILRIYESTNDCEADDYYKLLKSEGRMISIQTIDYHPRSEGTGKHGCSVCQEYHKIARKMHYDLIVMSEPPSKTSGFNNEEHITGLLMKETLR